MTGGARALWLAVALVGVSCTNEVAAPAICPQFCPAGALVITDTILAGVISRDSAYGRPYGYVNPNEALTLLAANVPGLRDSRPILLLPPLPTSLPVAGTVTGPVVGVDSLTLQITITQRDTSVHNLELSVYGLPVPIDSTATFASLSAAFAAPPVRMLNVDSLVASPNNANSATGDSVLVDTVYNRVTVFVNLDSAEAPYSVADSGQLAFGIHIAAAEPAEVAFGAVLNFGLGPVLIAYLKVDSLGLGICHRQTPFGFGSPTFNSFVFNPPAPALDSTLVVGGVPAARSILRIAFPRMIRDSLQIARATLEFIPAVLPQGLPADSFGLVAQAALVDLGSKSSLDPIHVDTTMIHIAPLDTVEVNVTNIMRFWASDTLAPTTIVLRQVPEGADFAEIRMFSSATANPALRPVLHLTYSPSYPFGQR